MNLEGTLVDQNRYEAQIPTSSARGAVVGIAVTIPVTIIILSSIPWGPPRIFDLLSLIFIIGLFVHSTHHLVVLFCYYCGQPMIVITPEGYSNAIYFYLLVGIGRFAWSDFKSFVLVDTSIMYEADEPCGMIKIYGEHKCGIRITIFMQVANSRTTYKELISRISSLGSSTLIVGHTDVESNHIEDVTSINLNDDKSGPK